MTRLVVVGDALLDIDVVGAARRLSPDAPVPVLDDIVEHPRPGGAALAAVMAAKDGHDVTLVTALGDDDGGRQLRELLTDITVIALPYAGPTPVKRRVRSAGQSLVRLDSGSSQGRITGVPATVATAFECADCVLVSDYGRGVSAVPTLRTLLQALTSSVPVVWDPHPRGADPVPGCHLVTPNRSEAASFARRPESATVTSTNTLAATRADAEALVRGWRVHAVAVTLSGRGALLTYGSGAPSVSPAPSVHCVDPCGAGDRFAVTAAVELAADRLPSEAVDTAVRSASAYVAQGGPAGLFAPARSVGAASGVPRASDAAVGGDVFALLDEVRTSGGTVVAAGGCFDLLHAGHIATLQSARSLGDCLVVCLNSDASVRRLKGPNRPLVNSHDRAKVLNALECVDGVVVFDEDTPADILDRVRPHIWVKGGDYAGVEVPEAAVLDRWGGQVVTLSYLPGRSTTQLASAAAGSAPTVVHEIEEMQS